MALNLIFVATIMILTSSNGYRVSAEFTRFKHPIGGHETLRFLVVGDWGRHGQYNQSRVAQQMGRIGEDLDIDFVVSTGDNFYDDGLTGVEDQSFLESYSNIYTEQSLITTWFVVLGNHDYRGDVSAQLSPVLNKIDNRWICLRSFIVDSGVVELFFVDTTPFVDEYFKNPKDHTYDWRGIIPVENYTANLLIDLELALKKSGATWKIVVGHHTIRSVGHHGDTQELVDRLLPILRAQDVDVYINGHDHNLQHISDSKSQIQFFTSGGGSKAWRGDVKDINNEQEELKFFYDGQGFMSVEVTQMELAIMFYDVDGRVVHQWTKSKNQLLLGI